MTDLIDIDSRVVVVGEHSDHLAIVLTHQPTQPNLTDAQAGSSRLHRYMLWFYRGTTSSTRADPAIPTISECLDVCKAAEVPGVQVEDLPKQVVSRSLGEATGISVGSFDASNAKTAATALSLHVALQWRIESHERDPGSAAREYISWVPRDRESRETNSLPTARVILPLSGKTEKDMLQVFASSMQQVRNNSYWHRVLIKHDTISTKTKNEFHIVTQGRKEDIHSLLHVFTTQARNLLGMKVDLEFQKKKKATDKKGNYVIKLTDVGQGTSQSEYACATTIPADLVY